MTSLKKRKIDPTETRLRQLLTELSSEFEQIEDDDDAGAVVAHALEEYGDVMITTLSGFLAMSIVDLNEEPDDEDDEDDEDED